MSKNPVVGQFEFRNLLQAPQLHGLSTDLGVEGFLMRRARVYSTWRAVSSSRAYILRKFDWNLRNVFRRNSLFTDKVEDTVPFTSPEGHTTLTHTFGLDTGATARWTTTVYATGSYAVECVRWGKADP